jgi:hypothetical protein
MTLEHPASLGRKKQVVMHVDRCHLSADNQFRLVRGSSSKVLHLTFDL